MQRFTSFETLKEFKHCSAPCIMHNALVEAEPLLKMQIQIQKIQMQIQKIQMQIQIQIHIAWTISSNTEAEPVLRL